MFTVRDENAERHTTGLGISLNDYMDQLEADLAPAIADKVSLAGCAQFEIITRRAVSGHSYAPTEEVAQHLVISEKGQIQFRANTWHNGPGKYGIGRVLETSIPASSVQEICRILDTWLYTREKDHWEPTADTGQWYIRVHQHDGREQIQRGSLTGAYVADMDLSWFIRDRITIETLYLFDQNL